VEQLGYGLGFTACMVCMVMVVEANDNPHKTAHYAMRAGFMALGTMLPGMAAGRQQVRLGCVHYFLWVCAAALPALAAAALARIEPAFGQRGCLPRRAPAEGTVPAGHS